MSKILNLIFNELNIPIDIDTIDSYIIDREVLISLDNYDKILILMPNIKKELSSTYFNCIHKCAEEKQKWPLLNLVRQLLKLYKFDLKPIRKANGYDINKKKKYKRYFEISKKK
jgi:hypothetical protein